MVAIESVDEFRLRFGGLMKAPVADARRAIEQDRAQVRRAALEEAALLMDSLMATYFEDKGHVAHECDASTAIRTMLLAEVPSMAERARQAMFDAMHMNDLTDSRMLEILSEAIAAEREPLERRLARAIESLSRLKAAELRLIADLYFERDRRADVIHERDALAERVSNRDAAIASITQQRDFAVAVIEARDREVEALETALSNLVQATQDPDYCTVCRRNTVNRPGHASWCWASKSLALLAPPAQQCKHDWVPSLRVIDPINPYPEVRGHHCSKCGAAENCDAREVEG